MYTHDISLEEVTFAVFDKMKKYWNLSGLKIREDCVQARILNPLIWQICPDKKETYCQFLDFLLDNIWLDEVCINDHGQWVKKYSRKIGAAEVRNLADIAANSVFETNYFEIKFKDPKASRVACRPTIEFREYEFAPQDAWIIGYQTVVPFDNAHLFKVALNRQKFFLIQGIWVPKNIDLEAKAF